MPIFELDTNLSRSDAGRDVKPELAEKLAELLGVAPENMCVVIRWEADLTFAAHQGGGAKEPCGTARVTSLKGLSAENNKKISAAVAAILKDGLGLGQDRYYIIFAYPGGGHNCGFDGDTFEGKM